MAQSRGSWLIWAAVAVGLLLRGYHYARGPAVWHDEAAMLVNVLNLPLADSLGPLLHDEAAPPLFLWLEKAVAAVLGDGVFALRLPAFLAACASVVLTAVVTRRLLPPVWAAVAVGLVAVSDRLLFHACEAKSYSFDVLIAVAAIWFVTATTRWPLWSRSLLGAVVAPACIWIAFPACFVFGGVLTALLPTAWRANLAGKAAFVTFALSVGVSFGGFVLGPAKAQRTPDMEACWEKGSFAPWEEPTKVPLWAVSNSFDVVRYSFHPYGWPLLVPVLVGVWAFLRKPGGWAVVCTAFLPMLLALLAACLGKYPYSASRLEAFLAPGLALLAVEGVRQFWNWFGGHRVWRGAVLLVWVPVLLIPAGYTARRVVDPWERAECDRAAEYVLQHRAADEPINANHWEYDYYLRRVDPALVRVEHNPVRPKVRWEEWAGRWAANGRPRIWYVHQEGVNSAHLPPVPPDTIPAGYRVEEPVTFGGVRVWELVPEK